MKEDRIKHYSPFDLGYGIQFRRLQTKISQGLFDFQNPTPIDIVELHNVTLFFQDANDLKEEPKSFLLANKEFLVQAKRTLSIHFRGIGEETIRTDAEFIKESNLKDRLLDYTIHDYLDALLKNVKVKDLPDGAVSALFEIYPLDEILRRKELAIRLENQTKGAILNNPRAFEFITANYDAVDTHGIYRLPSFTGDEINELAMAYCGLSDPSPRCLEFLINHKDNKDSYVLKRKTRITAKNALDKFWSSISDNPNYVVNKIPRSIGVEVKDGMKIPIDFQYSGGTTKVSLSSEVFKSTKNPLEAFKWTLALAALTDQWGCCTWLPYNDYAETAISKLFENPQVGFYGSSGYFDKQAVQKLVFISLANNYERHGISLFEGCRQFVDEMINPLLQDSKITLKEISGNTYFEKCCSLVPQIEGVLLQFRIYVEEGEISDELIEANRSSLKIEDYPSLIPGKYYSLSPKSNEAAAIRSLLFGDQSSLTYLDKERNANSFAELMGKFRVSAKSFDGFSQERLQFLLGSGVIADDESGLRFADSDVSFVWNQFQKNQFIPSYAISQKQKEVLDQYVGLGWCDCYSKLFSKEEADFLNYWLNDSKYSNAVALRNKYAHGATVINDDEKCREDCWMALRILMICLSKIFWDVDQAE